MGCDTRKVPIAVSPSESFSSIEAPAFNRINRAWAFWFEAAQCNGVLKKANQSIDVDNEVGLSYLWEMSFAFTSAPLVSNKEMQTLFPLSTAAWRAVRLNSYSNTAQWEPPKPDIDESRTSGLAQSIGQSWYIIWTSFRTSFWTAAE